MDWDKVTNIETIVTTTNGDVYTSEMSAQANSKKIELTISFLPQNGTGWVNKMVVSKDTSVKLSVDKKANVFVELTTGDETKEVAYNKDGHLIGKKGGKSVNDGSALKRVKNLF